MAGRWVRFPGLCCIRSLQPFSHQETGQKSRNHLQTNGGAMKVAPALCYPRVRGVWASSTDNMTAGSTSLSVLGSHTSTPKSFSIKTRAPLPEYWPWGLRHRAGTLQIPGMLITEQPCPQARTIPRGPLNVNLPGRLSGHKQVSHRLGLLVFYLLLTTSPSACPVSGSCVP